MRRLLLLLSIATLAAVAGASCASSDCAPSDPTRCDGTGIGICTVDDPQCVNCTYHLTVQSCPAARPTCAQDQDHPVCLGAGLVTSCVAGPLLPGGALHAPVVGDFNGDGRTDIAALDPSAPGYVVLLGTGSAGALQAQPKAALPGTGGSDGTHQSPSVLLAGDFDGDAVPDLVTNGPSVLLVLHGRGDGTFALKGSSAASNSVRVIGTADVNGDGLADVVGIGGGNASEVTEVFLGSKAGPLVAKSTEAPGMQGTLGVWGRTAGVLADFNEDGKVDLVAPDFVAGSMSIRLGDGSGGFASGASLSADAFAAAVVAADLNGDHHVDLAVTNATFQVKNAQGIGLSSEIEVMLGNGDGTFHPAILTDTSRYGAWSMIAADLDGDGVLDLVVADNGDGDTMTIRLGAGDGTFRPGTAYRVVNETANVAAALEPDAQGRMDVLLVTPAGLRLVAHGCN